MKTLIAKLLFVSLAVVNSQELFAQSERIKMEDIILSETSSRLETYLRRNVAINSLFPSEFLAAGHKLNQGSFPNLVVENELKSSRDYVMATLELWAAHSSKAIDVLTIQVLGNNIAEEIFSSTLSPNCTFSFPQLPASMPAIVGEELRKQLFSQLLSLGWKYDSAKGDVLVWFELSTKWQPDFEYQVHVHYLNFPKRFEKSLLLQSYDDSLVISSPESFGMKALLKKLQKNIPACQNFFAGSTPTEVP